jgi:DNA-directed RNA polymerase subunit H (RpoH/RPB5)
MDEVLDLLIRSRTTLLEILEDRGFDIASYKDESPEDLITKSSTALTNEIELELMKIQVKHKETEQQAFVFYWMGSVKQKRKTMFPLPEELGVKDGDDVIIVLNEPIHDEFHLIAIRRRDHEHISFFNIRNLISNPTKHVLVPPHRKLTPEEAEEVRKEYFIDTKSSSKPPDIKYHRDMIARIIGLRVGDIVEITRPSITAGESKYYRICSV